jgi:hypothetical protein
MTEALCPHEWAFVDDATKAGWLDELRDSKPSVAALARGPVNVLSCPRCNTYSIRTTSDADVRAAALRPVLMPFS